MTEELKLVEIMNDEVVTTSKQVAEVFGKEHRNVMKDIRELMNMLESEDCSNSSSPQMERFEKTTYKNSQNKQQPMYIMNRDAFTLLVMGYTTKNALKFKRMYIQAFNAMEKKLKEQGSLVTPSYQIEDPVKRAERWIEEEKERQRLLLENEEKEKYIEDNKERTLLGQAVEQSETDILVGDLAKILRGNGIKTGQNRLFEWLRQNNYLGKEKAYYNKPTQKSMELGLFKVKESTYVDKKRNITKTTFTTVVTPKGQTYFINKFLG